MHPIDDMDGKSGAPPGVIGSMWPGVKEKHRIHRSIKKGVTAD